ncbi:hypothetical protein POM88_041468 [Heracleum sosnowskyi]|uniref:Uncharacterized protein n=1 Tax=Heracleum sosnowskyi TaxID=360622 RepID=A0AAD8HGU5_9APIA|nr:hypothetical protein POM88_041468 [Heracleum sosnowskyi]
MEPINVNVNARWRMPLKGIIKGDIVSMICESIRFEDQRENEYNSFMELNQRRQDKNFCSEVFLADFEDNALLVYLAEYGAQNFKEMVVMEEPFGRVQELWNLDMGLGPIGPRFQARRLQDVVHNAAVEDVVNLEDLGNNFEEGEDEVDQFQMVVDRGGIGLHVVAATTVGFPGIGGSRQHLESLRNRMCQKQGNCQMLC